MGREYVKVVPADAAQKMLLMKNRNHNLPCTFLSRTGMEGRKLRAEEQTVEWEGCISQKGQRRELQMGDGMIRALIHIKGEVHYNRSVWPLGLVQTSVLSSWSHTVVVVIIWEAVIVKWLSGCICGVQGLMSSHLGTSSMGHRLHLNPIAFDVI